MKISDLMVERDPTTGRYILRFNASLYKESNCDRKVWFTLFRGLTGEGKDFKMEYGTAFHKGLAAMYGQGKSMQEALQIVIAHYNSPDIHVPETDWRTTAHLVNCFMQYHDYWHREGEMLKPLWCEQTFALPYYRTDLTEVLLCGTLDMKAFHRGYMKNIIVDHKTTSLTQVDSYLNEYEMSPQLMLYKLVHNRLFPGDEIHGCMINGIFMSRSNKNTFKRSQLWPFSEAQMVRFESRLRRRIASVVEQFEILIDGNPEITEKQLDEMFPTNYTCCAEKYGMCSYKPICTSDNYENAEVVIGNDYVKRIYDPTRFQA